MLGFGEVGGVVIGIIVNREKKANHTRVAPKD